MGGGRAFCGSLDDLFWVVLGDIEVVIVLLENGGQWGLSCASLNWTLRLKLGS